MKLGQPEPGFGNRSPAIQISYLCGLASVESGRILFTMVTRDTSQMLTLCVLLWLNSPVGHSPSTSWLHEVMVNQPQSDQ